jgi:hypothetical protein
MFEAMVVSSPAEFAAAVAEHPFADFAFEPEMLARAARTLVDTGLFVVGEPHGVRETPSVLYALASVLGTRALALEWSHEAMDEPVQTFLRSAAGQFALLQRLHLERRLDQVIVFDRLDPEPPPDDWQVRDREMAARILAEWDRRLPLLVLTGAFHAQLDAAEGATMAAHLVRELAELQPAMLDYASGQCWSRGELHDASAPMPDAPIKLQAPKATPAIVPSPASR